VEKTTYQGGLWSVLLTKYNLGDQIKKTEMGWTYSTYGERIGAYAVLVGNMREIDHLQDAGLDGRLI
jgi:hypothetical protein